MPSSSFTRTETTVKLYTFSGAPNPRRVTLFAAEKGIDLALVEVDLRGGETRSAAFRAKNPSGKIPVLELEDGTCLAESVAICRYLEALVPEPNLFGTTPSKPRKSKRSTASWSWSSSPISVRPG